MGKYQALYAMTHQKEPEVYLENLDGRIPQAGR